MRELFKITANLVIIYLVGGLLLAAVYSVTSPIIFIKTKEEKEAALSKMMPLHLIANIPAEKADLVLALMPEGITPDKEDLDGGEIRFDALVDIYDKELAKLKKKIRKTGATFVGHRSDNIVTKVGDWESYKHAEYFRVDQDDALTGYIVETYGKGYSSYINILVAISPDYTVRKINVLQHGETPGLGDEIELSWFKDMFRDKAIENLEVVKGETKDKIQAITGATISTRAVTNGVRDALVMIKDAPKEPQVAVEAEGTHE